MKKSSLLINASLALLLACQGAQQKITEDKIQPPPDSIVATDRPGPDTVVPASGTAGTDKAVSKDTAKPVVKPRAINHSSPEQDKIDSIKKAKTKGKR